MTARSPDAALSDPANAKRILFVYDRAFSTFIERDWKITARAWPRSELFCYRGFRDVGRLHSALQSADLCLAWFGARQALAAAYVKPPHTPLVIVAGGYDVARLPEIGYGTFAHPFRAALGRRLFGSADRVLAVSEFTACAARENAGVPPERVRVIHHGFDAEAWPMATGPRTLDAVTVAGEDPMVKGIDLLFGAASAHPERRFEVIGPMRAGALGRLGLKPPENVTLTGPLYGAELKGRLAAARVYLQPSRHESFGCAVAEAMLTGCVPVVTRSSALPEVVGDAGFYADELTPASVARALEQAWAAPEEARAA
ncbi:MAG TPA: glycosyltransferase family 4 protein, partial [Vicinamibacterales bacterium]|nr:glycosyltransferase family 4 protein [Vicinamibacterales bacterium]